MCYCFLQIHENAEVAEFFLQMKLILYNRLQFSAGVSKTDEWANRILFSHIMFRKFYSWNHPGNLCCYRWKKTPKKYVQLIHGKIALSKSISSKWYGCMQLEIAHYTCFSLLCRIHIQAIHLFLFTKTV